MAQFSFSSHKAMNHLGWYRLLIISTLAVAPLTAFGAYTVLGGGLFIMYVVALIIGLITVYTLSNTVCQGINWVSKRFGPV